MCGESISTFHSFITLLCSQDTVCTSVEGTSYTSAAEPFPRCSPSASPSVSAVEQGNQKLNKAAISVYELEIMFPEKLICRQTYFLPTCYPGKVILCPPSFSWVKILFSICTTVSWWLDHHCCPSGEGETLLQLKQGTEGSTTPWEAPSPWVCKRVEEAEYRMRQCWGALTRWTLPASETSSRCAAASWG